MEAHSQLHQRRTEDSTGSTASLLTFDKFGCLRPSSIVRLYWGGRGQGAHPFGTKRERSIDCVRTGVLKIMIRESRIEILCDLAPSQVVTLGAMVERYAFPEDKWVVYF